MKGPAGILVADFDSTFTRFDFYDHARKCRPVSPGDDPWEKYHALKNWAVIMEMVSC